MLWAFMLAQVVIGPGIRVKTPAAHRAVELWLFIVIVDGHRTRFSRSLKCVGL